MDDRVAYPITEGVFYAHENTRRDGAVHDMPSLNAMLPGQGVAPPTDTRAAVLGNRHVNAHALMHTSNPATMVLFRVSNMEELCAASLKRKWRSL